jgi:hypothetical protein
MDSALTYNLVFVVSILLKNVIKLSQHCLIDKLLQYFSTLSIKDFSLN